MFEGALKKLEYPHIKIPNRTCVIFLWLRAKLSAHDIPNVAKLLGRGEEACKLKLKRLGIPIKNVPKGTYVIFPKPDADLRRELVKKLMPKVYKAVDKCPKEKELKDSNMVKKGSLWGTISTLREIAETLT